MLIIDKHGSDVCCDEVPVPQIDRKSKQIKEQLHGKSQVLCFPSYAKCLTESELLTEKGSTTHLSCSIS